VRPRYRWYATSMDANWLAPQPTPNIAAATINQSRGGGAPPATGSVGTFDPVKLVLPASLDRSPRLARGQLAPVTQDIEVPTVGSTQDIEIYLVWSTQDIEDPEVRTT
jgi:hypothetical protein